jgi:hypothetical protein
LVSEPLKVVRQIYQRLNRHLVESASDRMKSLAARRSRYKGRGGNQTLADLGVDEIFDSQRLAACYSQSKIGDIDFASFFRQG